MIYEIKFNFKTVKFSNILFFFFSFESYIYLRCFVINISKLILLNFLNILIDFLYKYVFYFVKTLYNYLGNNKADKYLIVVLSTFLRFLFI